MKKKTAWFYLILMIVCVVLNIGIRIVGAGSLLNFFSVIVASFTCGLYTSEVFELYVEEKKNEKFE